MTPADHQLTVGFDLDMTLIDSRPGVVATFAALNAELGTTIDGVLIANRLGPTLEAEMAELFPPERVPAVCTRYRELYAEHGPPGSSLLPGASAAVDSVRSHHGRAVVITAKYEPNARRCLQFVGLDVDDVVGWRHGPGKGDALREHGAAVYVGDTPPDMLAAQLAGAAAVGVVTGPHSAPELRGAGAHAVLDSLVEFPAWLAAWYPESA
jgi:phosphoglycolate phosphatase